MFKILLRAGALALAMMTCAYAETTATGGVTITAPSATIQAQPFVDFLRPYVDLIVTAVVGAVLTWIGTQVSGYLTQLKAKTGIDINTADIAKLKSSAATEAGALVASAEDNLRGRSFDVGSPTVARMADNVIKRLPDTVNRLGVTPEVVQKIVVGEIGKLQASAPAAPAAAGAPVSIPGGH